MPMLRFVFFRCLGAVGMLLAVSFLIYVMTDVLPGDVATRVLGRSPDPEQLALLRQRLGIDQPLLLRYFDWINGLLQGDFGVSLVSGQPVAEIVATRVWNSSLLAFASLVIYLPLAVVPAIVQAANRDSWIDHTISAISLALLSIPDFLLATVLMILFAILIPIAPARSTIDQDTGTWATLHALALPTLTIAIVMGTYAMRYLRDSLIEAMASDYVKMARLNGMPERRLLWRHALPNALVPALNVTSLNLTYLFGGVVVVEQVFAFPGFGALMVASLMQLDVPLVQVTVLISASVYIFGNLVADILSMLVNPRLRHVS